MSRPLPHDIETMAELRAVIDGIDRNLVSLLAERQSLIDRAPALKLREGIAAAVPSRVAEVLARVRDQAAQTGFEPGVAEAMWQIMIDAMIAREERAMGKEGQKT